jgi:hypothetical protein
MLPYSSPGQAMHASFHMAGLRAWPEDRANQWDKKEKTKIDLLLFNNPIPIFNYQDSKVKQWRVLLPQSSHILEASLRREGTLFLFCQFMIFYFNFLRESSPTTHTHTHTHTYIYIYIYKTRVRRECHKKEPSTSLVPWLRVWYDL